MSSLIVSEFGCLLAKFSLPDYIRSSVLVSLGFSPCLYIVARSLHNILTNLSASSLISVSLSSHNFLATQLPSFAASFLSISWNINSQFHWTNYPRLWVGMERPVNNNSPQIMACLSVQILN